MSYTHITDYERIAVESFLNEGESKSKIGKRLGRSHTSIGREVKRNSNPNSGKYEAKYAIEQSKLRQSRKQRKYRIAVGGILEKYTQLINFRARKRLHSQTPYKVFFKKKFKLCTSI